MKIRTQFIISLVLFAVMLAVIGISLFATSVQLDRTSNQEINANDIAQGATELGYLANDYILNGEPQQRTRWETRFNEVTTALSQLDTTDPATATLVNDIKTNQQSLQTVFADVANTITTNPMTDPAVHLAFIQVSWSRLQVPTQAIVFDASRLPNVFEDDISQIHLRQLILLVAVVILMIGYFIANYLLVNRRTLRSIAELQTGARFVGNGELDYVIPAKYDDEISDLARSFNKMTASLKTVTASKADLEQEIAKRTEAEEELHITNKELKIANENLQDNAQKLELEMNERAEAQEALARSKERLDLALTAANMGTFEWDIPNNHRDWDDNVHRLFGLEPGSYDGTKESFFKVIHPEDRDRVEADLTSALENSLYQTEYRAIWRDGSVHHVAARGKVSYDGSGRPLRMAAICWDITERKNAEIALKESEAKAQALIKYAPTGIYEIDFSGPSFISVNEAMSILSGYTREELFNIGPMGLLDDQSRRKFADRMRRQLTGERIDTEVTYRFKKKDGTFSDVVLNVAFSQDKPGTALVIGHDVSERKRAEEVLEATLQRFYQMLGSMYAGVLLMTEGGKVELVNQAFCDAYGLKETPDELKGISSADLLARIKPAYKDPGQAETRIREILQRMEPVLGEQFEMRNGRTAVRDFTPVTVAGKSAGRLWTHTDITKLKRVEKELAASNEKINEILTSITDDFYVLDQDWNFSYTNKQFTGKIGKEPSDFIGNNIWKMFPNHVGTLLEENFRSVMQKREMRRFEIGGKYTKAWYRMTAFPSAEGITVIGEDITGFKKAEESLRESYEELERINRAAVGRELKMIELKKEINRYYVATGQPPRYMLDVDEDK